MLLPSRFKTYDDRFYHLTLREIDRVLENILADPMKLTHDTLNKPHTAFFNKKVDRRQ
jgi:hypothetical protein